MVKKQLNSNVDFKKPSKQIKKDCFNKNITFVLYIIQNLICGAIPSILTPAIDIIETIYGQPTIMVSMTASLISIGNVIAAFPSNYIILRLGLRKSLM